MGLKLSWLSGVTYKEIDSRGKIYAQALDKLGQKKAELRPAFNIGGQRELIITNVLYRFLSTLINLLDKQLTATFFLPAHSNFGMEFPFHFEMLHFW